MKNVNALIVLLAASLFWCPILFSSAEENAPVETLETALPAVVLSPDVEAEAHTQRGYLHLSGQGHTRKNFAKARKAFQSALGLTPTMPRASLLLGYMMLAGKGGPRDREQAAALLTPLAQSGEKNAQFWLAALHHQNDDFDKAFHWVTQAKTGEHAIPEAHTLLGLMYLNGEGVETHYGMAYTYFQRAAATQEPLALYKLGLMHLLGIAAQASETQGLSYLKQSEAAGYRGAKKILITVTDGQSAL